MRERPFAAQHVEHGEARTAVDHVVFRVDFKPEVRRRRGKRLLEIFGLEADTGGGTHHGLPVGRAQRAVALGRLDRRAGALGDIFPRVALEILARRARAAGAGTRFAVVLAGERNAVALVHAGLRRNRTGLGRRSGQRGKHGGGGKSVELVHGSVLTCLRRKSVAPREGQRGTPRDCRHCEGARKCRPGNYMEESGFPEWNTSEERTTAGTLPWLTQ